MNFDKMPKKSKWRGRIALCAVIVIIAGTLWYFFYDDLSDRITRVFASTEKEPVPTARLERQPFSLTVSADGEIIGLDVTTVEAPNTSAGQLTIAWLIPQGTFVNAGDLIVRFDSTSIQLNLESRQNELENNLQNTKVADNKRATDEKNRKIDLQIAEENYNYSVKVLPQDETIFSRWEIITKAADERYDRENLDVMKNRIRTQQRSDRSNQQVQTIARNRIQTEVGRYENTLNSLELRAPVGGLVLYYLDRQTEPAVGDSAYPGRAIIEIVNLDALQVKINVLERDGGYLEKDLPVNIHLDAVPNKVYHGVIRSVSSVATSLTRNSPLRYFTCEVTISDAGPDMRLIRPGMYLRGDIVLHEYESCFIVPSSAVTARELQKDNVVYVETGPGRFEARVVETGMSSYGEAVILSGVEEGEIVALVDPSGPRKLTLPDFNLSQPAGQQAKPKMMIMGGPGGGGGGGGMRGGGGGRF
ncbi:MAG: efflux RND transporter periplasmic adaptor subunit [Acidobacteriota bacterium]|jgi:multidrug efflux pump subunit AcrA (membrane-fusion protein)|nr:efflux RND transporter periplasmic adaptor subunit [Acidobacteriota bacterium]